MYNIVPIQAVVGYVEPHILEFRDAEEVINPFFVETNFNGTELYPLVSEWGSCIAMSKLTSVPFPHIHHNIFI